MSQAIHLDIVVQQELLRRGVDTKTGVFGDHKVQFGKGLPISIDKIKTPSLPFAGFTTATKISRGKEGISKEADNLLRELTAPANKLNASKILSAIKAGHAHFERLKTLGQIARAQQGDTMWMFTKSVEKLSNADLAAVYQSFTSAEMDLLQTALQREGAINPDAKDARWPPRVCLTCRRSCLRKLATAPPWASSRISRPRTPTTRPCSIYSSRKVSPPHGAAWTGRKGEKQC